MPQQSLQPAAIVYPMINIQSQAREKSAFSSLRGPEVPSHLNRPFVRPPSIGMRQSQPSELRNFPDSSGAQMMEGQRYFSPKRASHPPPRSTQFYDAGGGRPDRKSVQSTFWIDRG